MSKRRHHQRTPSRQPTKKPTLAQLRKTVENQPMDPAGWKALGEHYASQKEWHSAQEPLERALELAPQDPTLLELMSRTENGMGNDRRAVTLLEEALAIAPDDPQILFSMARVLHDRTQDKEALGYTERALAVAPKNLVILAHKGNVLYRLHRYNEAIEVFKSLTKQQPDKYSHWNNAGNLLRDLGELDEAVVHYQKADKLSGSNAIPFSNHLTALHYHPHATPEDIFALSQEWEKRFAPRDIPQRPVPHDTALNKRLRIGMISDGFRSHPVGKMITAALEQLATHEFELFAYSTNNAVDPLTVRIRNTTTQWKAIPHLSDEALAQQIRDDQIDILIDLAGHNTGSRMPVMAMQPAPLLVKWVGGLINTTGLSSIDYLISDAIETPQGSDDRYVEKLIRLPDDYICYEPPARVPAVSALPANSNGYITLGCFNNAAKVNAVVLGEWAKIMHQLPDSRLFLKSFQYNSADLCDRVRSLMAEHGIAAERLIIEGASPHFELLEAYHRVDIALDPWPYSGGLTTCEAFMMGVPVVTLPGPTFAGRHSATHLVNAGMPELVTHSWEEYRQRVIGLAGDLESLSTIRTHLHDILLQSPVCDAPRFAEHFTTAMRAIWQRYCEGKPPAALTLDKTGQAQFEGEDQPVEVSHPEPPPEDESGFKWQFTGKIVTLDNGALLTGSAGAAKLLGLGAFGMISFDPANKITQPEKLQAAGELHHYPHVVLGDGNPATLYACLDPEMSATLRPLPTVPTLTGEAPGPKVLAQLPVNSIQLDKIEGLETIDWLILDNMNDSLAVLEHGEKALADTLLIQARINFQPTHENQPELTLISHWAARHGFRFYRLNNETHISHLPERDDLLERQATQLASADAIYLPNAERMAALDDNQRMKLAFVLHTVYGMKDVAYQVLANVEEEKAEAYWEVEQDQPLPQPATTLPKAASARPDTGGTQAPQSFEYNWKLEENIKVVDIGANPIDGSPPYAALLKQGKINLVGFEPQREALAKLQTMKGPNETYLPHAVGDGKEARLYLCQAPGMTSTLKPNNAVLDQFQGYPIWGKVKQVELIKTVRLDDVKEIKGIDWLKIDIQGGELTVFKNGENQLKDTLVIQTEVNFIQLYENQPLFAEIDQWMRAHGFMLHTLLEERKRLYAPMVLNGQIHQGLNQLTTADAVYIKDITKLEEMSHLQIEKMAFILSEAYGSHDLALRLMKNVNSRGAGVKDLSLKKNSIENKDGVFVHLLFNTIHTQPLLDVLQDETAAAGFTHHILIEKGRAIPGYDVDIRKNPNAFYFSKSTQLNNVLEQCLKDNVLGVFFHGLFFDWQKLLIKKIMNNKRLIWSIWGGDLYNPINENKLLTEEVRYIDAITTVEVGDYHVFQKAYGEKKRLEFRYPSNVELSEVRAPATKKKRIIVGNSGDPSNNHIEIIRTLSMKADVKDYSLVIPMSYNAPPAYKAKVEKELADTGLFGCSKILENILPAKEYLELLAESEILITAHRRQQAVGNLAASIYFGNKTILRKEFHVENSLHKNPVWEAFSENEFPIFDFEEFKRLPSIKSIPTQGLERKEHNKSKIELLYGKQRVMVLAKQAFLEIAQS